jgi:opacity protein-like surface antigen
MKTNTWTALGLAALLAAPAVAAADTDDADLASPAADAGPSLKLSGFADINYTKFLYSDPRWENEENIPKNGAFSVGNLNLYLDGRLDQQFRSLVEVRFTYLPNGLGLQGDTSGNLTTGTRVIDYAQLRATAQWGGIVLERAWVEYRHNQLLTLRAGQFLTPYGQWNVDHGSPTLIDVAPPFIIGQELFPKSQVGLEAYGATYAGDARIGYHLTASNGRIGNNPQFLDFNSAFGLGGRAFVEGSWVGELKVGVSAYGGKEFDKVQGLSLQDTSGVSSIPFPFYLPFTRQTSYTELSMGVDARWDWKDLVVVGEYLRQRLTHQQDTTTDFTAALGAPPTVTDRPDYTKEGYYLIVGYKLPHQVMPFVMYQYLNDSTGSQDTSHRNAGYGYTGGVNWRVRPNVVAKASYTISKFPDADPAWVNAKKFDWFSAQLAWAF